MIPPLTLREVGVDTQTAVGIVNAALAATQVDPVTAVADTPLHALGLDSLEFTELFMELEEAAGGEIDPESMIGLVTVADLTKLRRL